MLLFSAGAKGYLFELFPDRIRNARFINDEARAAFLWRSSLERCSGDRDVGKGGLGRRQFSPQVAGTEPEL
jgi:hypothetical protein